MKKRLLIAFLFSLCIIASIQESVWAQEADYTQSVSVEQQSSEESQELYSDPDEMENEQFPDELSMPVDRNLIKFIILLVLPLILFMGVLFILFLVALIYTIVHSDKFGKLWINAWNSIRGKILLSLCIFALITVISLASGMVEQLFALLYFLSVPALIVFILCKIIGVVSSLAVVPFTGYGYSLFFLKMARSEKAGMETIFEPRKHYLHYICVHVTQCIFIMLWSLLFIIPGIIAALAYAMAVPVALDHPELSARETLKLSRDLMAGHKFEYFCYMWVFSTIVSIGGILTLGIGLIWLFPMLISFNFNYYLTLKKEKEERDAVLLQN